MAQAQLIGCDPSFFPQPNLCRLLPQLLSCDQTAIFGSLSHDDSLAAYRILVELILATDMAKHGNYTDDLRRHLEAGSVPKSLALKMMMKTADLSNVCKPFDIAKHWASAITEEFFYQGDMVRPEPQPFYC